jgi:hypothetical protein
MELGTFSEQQILQAVRKSLKGSSAEILLHMGSDAKVSTLIEYMDHRFGNVLPVDELLGQFCLSTQKDSESATAWACRLEEKMARIIESDPMMVSTENSKRMIRKKFWSGLKDKQMQTALRYHIDSDYSFEKILVSARIFELENKSELKVQVNQTTEMTNLHKKQFDDMTKRIEALSSQMEGVQRALENQQSGSCRGQHQSNGANLGRGQEFVRRRGQFSATGPDYNSAAGFRSGSMASHAPTTVQAQQNRQTQQPPQRRPFQGICYRCKQPGHIKAECPLNYYHPV